MEEEKRRIVADEHGNKYENTWDHDKHAWYNTGTHLGASCL